MKKTILLTLLLMAMLLPVEAQRPVDKARAGSMTTAIVRANKAVRSLTSTFRQTKDLRMLRDKVVSRGRLYYVADGRLRWEYTSPTRYALVIKGNEVLTKSGSGVHRTDMSRNRQFQRISKMIVGSMDGTALTNQRDYAVTLFDTGSEWFAWISPRRGDLKNYFKGFRVHFDRTNHLLKRVDIYEKNGDTTVIELTDTKTNGTINDALFSLR